MLNVLLLIACSLQGEEPAPGPKQADPVWFPSTPLYLHPLADPRAPYGGSRLQFPLRKGDNLKSENVFATHFALLRLGDDEGAYELEFEAAAFSRFDVDQALDMDGADYRFGFPFVYRKGRQTWKLHLSHITSHLGDEFAEREGRTRIPYARNEIAPGLLYQIMDSWRVYGEFGWGFKIGEPNKPWRVMAGTEYVGRLLGAKVPEVFAAVNLSSSQETDWNTTLTAQFGLWMRPKNSPRAFRFGFEYFRGNSPLTQFFEDREEYWSFGFWVHF